MARVGPAAFVFGGAGRGYVLHMGGRDAALVGLDPGNRVRAAALHPGEVNLPFQVRAAFQYCRHRDRAIGLRLEFKIVVVPAKAHARRTQRRPGLLQPGPERAPAGGIRGPVVGHYVRAIDLVDAKGLGDLDREIGLVFQHVEAHVGGLHHQSIGLQARRQFSQ